MLLLIVGLVLFLGIHSTRIVAEGARQRFIAERGDKAWKGIYSIVSLLGFVLIIYGYGQARLSPTLLWLPPTWSAHLNMLLTAVAFILLAAPNIPGNRIRSAVGHPMALGVAIWAFGHLMANGELANVVLFAAFLIWATASYIAAHGRDRKREAQPPATGGIGATILTIGAGLFLWVVFAGWLHLRLIGVSPFGG